MGMRLTLFNYLLNQVSNTRTSQNIVFIIQR